MSRSKKTKISGKNNTGTQTQDADTVLEIARLQEQVKLLRIEIKVLRKHNAENVDGICAAYNKTINKDALLVTNSQKTGVTPENPGNEQQKSKSTTKAVARGCACRGNCSNKVCGCVKKDNKCGSFCRCNNLSCKDKDNKDLETDKENVDNENINHPAFRLDNTIVNRHLENFGENKSLFSPALDGYTVDLNDKQFKTGNLYFGSPKKLTFVSDDEGESNLNKPQTKRGRGRPKIYNCNPFNPHHRDIKSLSDEEEQQQNKFVVVGQKLRRCVSTEIDSQSDGDNNTILITQAKTRNYKQNVMHGTVSLRRGRQKIAEVDPERNGTAENEIVNQNLEPKIKEQQGEKLVFQKKVRKYTKSKDKRQNTDKSNSALPLKRKTTSTQLLNKFDVLPGNNLESTLEMQLHNTEHDDKEKTELSDSEVDVSFDPMKPKHQLPRTPPDRTSNESESSKIQGAFLRLSKLKLQDEKETKEENEISPPPDFFLPHIDWEEYQSLLVACRKCNRKFHPSRIEKHESCCKNL